MEREEVRLQCLRIRAAERPQLQVGQLVEEAKVLEAYVTEEVTTEEEPLRRRGRPPKSANPDDLS